MSETKWTDGTWQWYWRYDEKKDEADCGVFVQEFTGMARSICRAPRYDTQAQWEANARLIAQAPAMAEVLHDLLWLARPHFSDEIQAGVVKRVEKVLAAARGDAQ